MSGTTRSDGDGLPAGSPAWVEDLRARPEGERLALLRSADARAGSGPAGLRHAVLVYGALAADLDPATRPEDAARLARMLESRHAPLHANELFARAVRDGTGAPALDAQCAVVVAQRAFQRGDAAEAERLYRRVVAGSLVRGLPALGLGLLGFAHLCVAGSRWFEALVLARAASRRLAAQGDRWGEVLAHTYLCSVLRALRDWERLAAAVEALDPATAHLDGPHRALARESLHAFRADVALGCGDGIEALAQLDLADAVRHEGGPAPTDAASEVPRAAALLHLGRAREAREILEAGRGDGPPSDHDACTREALLVGCRLRLEGPAAGIAAVDALVAHLRSPEGRRLGPGVRHDACLLVARALEEAGVPPDAARDAYEAAADAAFERLVEVERFLRDFGEVAPPSPEDLAVLADVRHRTVAEHGEMARAVARRMGPEEASRPRVALLTGEGDVATVCAWCTRVRTEDGRWLSVQQFLPLVPSGPLPLTHGICPDCLRGLTADLKRLKP